MANLSLSDISACNKVSVTRTVCSDFSIAALICTKFISPMREATFSTALTSMKLLSCRCSLNRSNMSAKLPFIVVVVTHVSFSALFSYGVSSISIPGRVMPNTGSILKIWYIILTVLQGQENTVCCNIQINALPIYIQQLMAVELYLHLRRFQFNLNSSTEQLHTDLSQRSSTTNFHKRTARTNCHKRTTVISSKSSWHNDYTQ